MSKTCSLQARDRGQGVAGLGGGAALGVRVGDPLRGAVLGTPPGPPIPARGRLMRPGWALGPRAWESPLRRRFSITVTGGRGEPPAPAGNSPRSKAAEGDKWGLLKWAGRRGAVGPRGAGIGDGGKGPGPGTPPPRTPRWGGWVCVGVLGVPARVPLSAGAVTLRSSSCPPWAQRGPMRCPRGVPMGSVAASPSCSRGHLVSPGASAAPGSRAGGCCWRGAFCWGGGQWDRAHSGVSPSPSCHRAACRALPSPSSSGLLH